MLEGNIECVKSLIKPAEKVIKKGFLIDKEMFEKRVQLWNEIRENFERYEDEECGAFLEDLDRHYRAEFEVALLILARSFRKNGEEFAPAALYNEKEIKAYEEIEKYNIFELLSIKDIKKKVIAKDENLINLFENYFVKMDRYIEEMLNDEEIRLELKYYLKKKWDNYKEKIIEAVNQLNKEFEWFGNVVREWKKEAENKARELINEKEAELDEKEKKFHEEIKELMAIKEKIEKGSRYVGVGEAKFYENNFIGRIKNKLSGELTIKGRKFEVYKIDIHNGINLVDYSGIDNNILRNLPENKYLVAKLKEKKMIGKRIELTLKAIFHGRTEKYAKYGVDTDPLDLMDINPYISEEIEENVKKVICIASPTGFTDRVREHIMGEELHKNFLSNISLILLDMETGEVIFNEHDEWSKALKNLCELEIDEEKVEKAKKCIRNLVIEKDFVTFEDAVKVCGEATTVKNAFYRLANERGYKIKYVKNVGLVMVR